VTDSEPKDPNATLSPIVLLRGGLGGVLMGLANLVPGISGGTMLLAAGVYPRFIAAVAEVSTLRLRMTSILLLGTVAFAAAAGIVLLAGPIKDLVVAYRWVMYSLFIGLTLGGLPVVWRMARPITPSVYGGAIVGFVAMGLLAILQMQGADGGAADSSFVMLTVAGLAGASAMILPGVSGGYLLLVLGQYIPILRAVDEIKKAVSARDWSAAMGPAMEVALPVAIGVIVGIVVVSNLLKLLLARFEKATLGVLVGLLLGAVLGLWPFQQGVQPEIGSMLKGVIVTAENLGSFDKEDWPTRVFTPDFMTVLGALGCVLGGALVTTLIAKLGGEEASAQS
jgi:putative membrane protein